MNIENEKIDCTDALTFGLNRTAQWREKMAVRYPSDPRNARAAECLLKLASEANELSDADWSRLAPHASWANEHWREAISQTARAVGFQHKVKDRLRAAVTKLEPLEI
jgi:hypothetical protein